MLQTVIICVYMPSKQRYSILRRQQVLVFWITSTSKCRLRRNSGTSAAPKILGYTTKFLDGVAATGIVANTVNRLIL